MFMRDVLKKRIHISWFIAWAAVGVLVGIALSLQSWSNSFTGPSWLIVCVSLFLITLIKPLKAFVVFALAAGLILGLFRGSTTQATLQNYSVYYNKTIVIQGRVVDDTSYGPHGDQRMRLGSVRIANKNLAGQVWVSSSSSDVIKRGDIVILSGQLSKGFGSLPAALYRAKVIEIQHPHPGDIGRQVRDWFGGGIKKSIPEPEASLGSGYLLGQRSALPETLDNQIKATGLTHAVVASGYNLTILVAVATKVFAKRSKYLATSSGGLMICGFILITGFSPSMTRAGLVSGLSLLAWYYGRKFHPLVLLPFAASVTAILNPSYIWGDIGWFLSFAAFTGIVLIAPLLEHYFWGTDKKPHILREILIGTVSAQAATLPIILYAFGQYSIYALPANLLVLPLVPLAMLLTFFAGTIALAVPSLATLAGYLAYSLLKYMTTVIGKIANLPGAQGEITFSIKELVLSYALISLVIIFLWRQTKHNFRAENTLI